MLESEKKKCAEDLFDARINKAAIKPLSHTFPNISLEDGYAIQQRLMNRYVSEGYHICGRKVGGFTFSDRPGPANSFGPHYGFIFQEMLFYSDEKLLSKDYIQPGIEAEIGFILGEDLGHGIVTGKEVLASTQYLVPMWEIVDSRQVKIQRILQDSIADNASFAGCIMGKTRTKPKDWEEVVQCRITTQTTAVPVQGYETTVIRAAEAVAWLVNALMKKGDRLTAGSLILSGALTTPLIPVKKGDVICADFGHLGNVTAVLD